MLGCILAGNIGQDNGYNEWLDSVMPSLNKQQREKTLAQRDYFGKTSPKIYRHMRADKDLYLSFFISAVQGCGMQLLAEVVALAKTHHQLHEPLKKNRRKGLKSQEIFLHLP